MSAPQQNSEPRQPQSGAQRRGRSRPGRGRGRGAAPGGGAGLLQAAVTRPAADTLVANSSGVSRAQEFSTTSGLAAGYESNRRFADTQLSPRVKQSVPWEFMSEIQAQTIDVAMTGKDLLGQAKTGTGKTVAFLLPILEKLLKNPPKKGTVGALILSPTRELALQIAKECEPFIKGTSLSICTLIGGTNIDRDVRNLDAGCSIVVGTPGRVKDHLANMDMKSRIQNLQAFVLDEADRLLDMGFSHEVRAIISHFPQRSAVPRQCMLFSATMPKAVLDIKSMVLLPDHAHVSTIDPGEINAHMHVEQHYLTAPLDQHFPILLHLIKTDIAKHGEASKIMAFYPTARGAELASDLLRGLDEQNAFGAKIKIYEQHSRLSMSARVKSSDGFRATKGGVMATSDVSGRGMDFPNVTLVIQMGPPAAGEDYVHRLGRTARAGTDGYGILVLAPFDKGFLSVKGMKEMPLKPHPQERDILTAAVGLRSIVDSAMDSAVETSVKTKSYAATLGLYATGNRFSKLSPVEVVDMANDYVFNTLRYPGNVPPPIKKQAAGKMGLSKMTKLNLVVSLPGEQPGGGRGGGGRGGARGGARTGATARAAA